MRPPCPQLRRPAPRLVRIGWPLRRRGRRPRRRQHRRHGGDPRGPPDGQDPPAPPAPRERRGLARRRQSQRVGAGGRRPRPRLDHRYRRRRAHLPGRRRRAAEVHRRGGQPGRRLRAPGVSDDRRCRSLRPSGELGVPAVRLRARSGALQRAAAWGAGTHVDPASKWVRTSIRIQHLGGLTEDARRACREKYQQLDPDHRWEPDYSYADAPRNRSCPWPPREKGEPVVVGPHGVDDWLDFRLAELDLEGPVLSVGGHLLGPQLRGRCSGSSMPCWLRSATARSK